MRLHLSSFSWMYLINWQLSVYFPWTLTSHSGHQIHNYTLKAIIYLPLCKDKYVAAGICVKGLLITIIKIYG